MLAPTDIYNYNLSDEAKRLYCAARLQGAQSAGYFILSEIKGFTDRSRRKSHNELIRKGFIINGHIVSPYRFRTTPISVQILQSDITNKKDFKTWLLNAMESRMGTIAKAQEIKEHRNNLSPEEKKRFKIERQHVKSQKTKSGDGLNFNKLSYELSNAYFIKALGISQSTLNRRRKHANTATYYEYKQEFSKNRYKWKESECYYSKKRNCFVKVRLHIQPKLFVWYDQSFFNENVFPVLSLI